MTAEKSIKILKAVKELKDDAIYTLTDLTEAYKMAIEALSKQSASCKQANESVIVNFVAFQREWLNSHKTLELDAVNNALVNIFLETTGKAFIDTDTLGQSAENDEDRAADDHIAEPGKMIKLEKRTIIERLIIAESLINSVIADSEQVSLPEQEKSNLFSEEPPAEGNSEMNCSDAPDIRVGKTDFQPGDKFILELGAERKMFSEFEIKGTDLYVKTSLLEKLTRYEPVANDGFVSKQAITDYLESLLDGRFKNIGGSGYTGLICGIRDNINMMKSEKIPYKKPEIIHCGDCRWYGKSHYCGANYPAPDDFCSWAERRNDG